MAQIKKLSTGGPVAEKTYGNIWKDAQQYTVNDNTLNWLKTKGSIGREIAEKLERGEDQHISFSTTGAGIVHGISNVSDLTAHQRRRLSRKQGLFEGNALQSTREIVQDIADMDYSKFETKKTPYSFDHIVLDYNTTKDANGKVVYELSDIAESNNKAILRINEIATNGFTIPEDRVWNGGENQRQFYEKTFAENKLLLSNLVSKLRNPETLDNKDKDLLQMLNISYKLPDTTETGESVDDINKIAQASQNVKLAKNYFASLLQLNTDEVPIFFEYFDIQQDPNTDDGWSVVAKDKLKKLLNNQSNYIFSDYDTPVLRKLKNSWVLINNKLFAYNSPEFKEWSENNKQFDTFLKYYGSGNFNEAKKIIGFANPTNPELNLGKSWGQWSPAKNIGVNLNENDYYYFYTDPTSKSYKYLQFIKDDSYHPYLPKIQVGDQSLDNWYYLTQIDNNLNAYRTQISVKNGSGENDRTGSFNVLFDPNKKTFYISALSKGKPVYQEIKKLDTNSANWEQVVINFYNKLKDYKKIPMVINKTAPTNILGEIAKQLNELLKNSIPSNKQGGVLKCQNGNVIQADSVYNPLSHDTTDVFEMYNEASAGDMIKSVAGESSTQISKYDVAELASLMLDIAGYSVGVASKSKNARIGSLISDALSEIGFLYSNSSDGLTLREILSSAVNIGLSAISNQHSRNKIIQKAQTAMRLVTPVFKTLGLSYGLSSFNSVLDKLQNGKESEISLDEIRGLWQGIKGLHMAARDVSDTNFAKKYTTRASKFVNGEMDPLHRIDKEKLPEIHKRVVTSALNNPDVVETGKTSGWYNSDTGEISDYAKAYNDLRKQGIISDTFILKHVTLKDGAVTKGSGVIDSATERVGSFWDYIGGPQYGNLKMNQYLTQKDIDDIIKNNKGAYRRFAEANDWEEVRPPMRAPETNAETTNVKTASVRTDSAPAEVAAPERPNVAQSNSPQPSAQKNPSATQQSLFDQEVVKPSSHPISQPELVTDISKIIQGSQYGKPVLNFPAKIDINSPILTKRPVIDRLGKSTVHYDIIDPVSQKRVAIYDNHGTLAWYLKDINSAGLPEHKQGGCIQKLRSGKIFDPIVHKGLSIAESNKDKWNDSSVNFKDATAEAKFNFAKSINGEFAKIANHEIFNDSNYWAKYAQRYGTFDPQGLSEIPTRNWFGLFSPLAELSITGVGNERVLEDRISGIRESALGNLKSVSKKKPTIGYNLNPIITESNNQKTDIWSKAMTINNSLTDPKMRLANSSDTISKIVQKDDNLLNTMTKRILDVDAYNTDSDWKYSEIEREIGDNNNKVSHNTKAGIFGAKADAKQEFYNNLTKFIAELRTDENRYLSQMRMKDAYRKLSELNTKLSDPTTPEDKKQEIMSQMRIIKEFISGAGSYSRLTGKYALEFPKNY